MKKWLMLVALFAAGMAFAADLPVKYLQYVESTGEQYVDTGFVPNSNTKIEATYQLVQTGLARNYVFGVYGASNTGRCQFSPAANTFVGFGNGYKDNVAWEEDTAWHTVVMDKGTFKVDGTQIYKNGWNGTSKNLCLFAVNGNGTASQFATNRISKVAIYDNGVLQRLMVPCEMGNGAVGFWDFANGRFYGDAAGGNFVAGPVASTSPVERLEYVRFANGTYVDTNVKPTDHETAIRFRDEKATAGGYLFGGANNNQWQYAFWSSGSTWVWGYSGASTRSNSGYTANVDHTVVYNDVAGGRVYIDGRDLGKAIDVTPSSNLYLGRRYNSYNYEGRIYWVKVTARATGEVVKWLEPVSIAGTVGFYDSVSGTFIVNAAGTLSAGPLMAGQFEIAGQNGFTVDGMSPVCGLYEDLAVGEEVAVSAPAQTVLGAQMTATVTGWKLYEWSDAAMDWVYNANRAQASGTGNSFSYVHTGVATKLEWQWSFANPLATGSERYVMASGDDAADGLSWATAKKTVQAAIDAAPGGGTVLVAPGYYYATHSTAASDSSVYAVCLERPVSVIGIAGPEKTTVDAGIDSARAGARITNADALLAGVSLVNCYYSAKNKPTGVEGNAGVFSNCWVKARGEWAHGGWILNASGTLKVYDMVMRPHTFDVGDGGYAVYMSGNAALDGFTARDVVITGSGAKQLLYLDGNAKASNVLIADCRFGKVEVSSLAPFVTVNGAGAVLADATVANNIIMANNGAVQVSNSKAIVTNCIVWANTSSSLTNPNIQSASNLARFFNSCCNEFATDNAQGNIIVDPQFVDAANGDYHLRSLSRAKDMGVVALRPSGEPTTFECAGDADNYVSASGESLEATFSGYCAGAQGAVSALWDFGDGATSTDWPTATHTYETPGSYTVTLTLNDGVSNPAVYTFAKQMVCTPATCYMSLTGSNTYPYDTWEKATPSLQAALDVGSRYIVVTNGNYEIPAPVIGISRAVSLTSVEGPGKTSFTSLGTTTCDHRNLTLGGSDAILVSGFTFNDGYAANYDWTASIQMSSGTLTNCVFKNIRRVSRSAACYFYGTAKVFDCVFDGHGMTWSNDSANQSGVRIEGSAVLDRCEIFAFSIANNAESGYDGESPVRIASANAVLRNSYVHHCTNGVPTSPNVKNRGPVGLVNGRIENCTIVNNVCAGYGGGVWAIGGTVVNSIIWDNAAGMAGNDVYVRSGTSPSFRSSCASDFKEGAAITGEGCTASAPNFDAEKPYHLTPLSTACLDTGVMLDWMTAGALDKDRLPRVVVNGEVAEEGVDMGCFEFQESTSVPLTGTIDFVGGNSGRVPYAASFAANIVGDEEGLTLVWDFGDGSDPVAGSKSVTHTYDVPGSYTVTVHAENSKDEEADIVAAAPVVVVPQVCYVSQEGNGIAPYMTWENAATNIFDAVGLNPKTVIVSNGTYKISNDITIQSDIELRSVNGPDVTIIDAQGLCRNLWMTDQAEGSVVDGFSLWRGSGHWDTKSNYARVEAGTLSNCILSNCYGSVYRDSAVLVKGKGRMVDCVVDTYTMGGNADSTHYFGTVVQSGGIIERCTIQRYNYTNQGGAGNTHGAVHVEGTGIFQNCLVRDCVTTQSISGDAKRAAVLVSGQGVVENCTIVNSKSCQPGAGLTILSGTPTVRNCIVWGATLGDGTATTAVRDIGSPDAPRLTFSCSPELAAGEGNTTADPLLGTRTNPFEPRKTSPCINTALKLDWMDETAIDLAGNPRIRNRHPDMGCYEGLLPGGTMILVR